MRALQSRLFLRYSCLTRTLELRNLVAKARQRVRTASEQVDYWRNLAESEIKVTLQESGLTVWGISKTLQCQHVPCFMTLCVAGGACAVSIAALCRMHWAYSSMLTSFRSETFSLTPCQWCQAVAFKLSCTFYVSLNHCYDSETQALGGLSNGQHLPRTQTWGNWVSVQAASNLRGTSGQCRGHLHALVPQGELLRRQILKNARPWRTPWEISSAGPRNFARAETVAKHVLLCSACMQGLRRLKQRPETKHWGCIQSTKCNRVLKINKVYSTL